MTDVVRWGRRTGRTRPWSRDYLRVVSWNIERGLRFSRVLRFLRAIRADLLLLQEVDLNARRTHYRDVAGELAQALDLNYVFGTEFQELSEGTAVRPAYHGMATLSPWPLVDARVIRFRDQSTFWKPRWYIPDLPVFQRRVGGRIALVADTSIYGRKVVSYNLHLESRGSDDLRVRQLSQVLEDCRRCADHPTLVVAGDFNFRVGVGAVARALREAGLHDAVRLPMRPTTTDEAHVIDWVFVSGTLGSRGQVHSDIRASDHYPVSATLTEPLVTLW